MGRSGIAADVMHLIDQRAAMEQQAKLCSVAETYQQTELAKLKASLGYLGTLPNAMAIAEKQNYLGRLTGDNRAYDPGGQLDKAVIAAVLGKTAVASASALALQTATQQIDLERLAGISNAADAYRQFEKSQMVDAASFMQSSAVADAVAQLHASDTVGNAATRFFEEQKDRDQAAWEQSLEDSKKPQILDMPYYNPMDAINRRREADRDYAIETARLAEIARLKVQDEHAAAQRAAATNQPQAWSVPDAPVEAVNRPNWNLTKPKKFQGYTEPLYQLLREAYKAASARPTAHDVLARFKVSKPGQVAKVLDGQGLDFYLADGSTKTADLRAITATIDRMTK